MTSRHPPAWRCCPTRSQGRDHYDRSGAFSLPGDLGTLLEQPGDDVFMLKVSYWIG